MVHLVILQTFSQLLLCTSTVLGMEDTLGAQTGSL